MTIRIDQTGNVAIGDFMNDFARKQGGRSGLEADN